MTFLLQIYACGSLQILKDGQPVRGFPSRAAEALLVYLACQDRPIGRELLAELLWAERTPQQALTNLRTILAALRREVGEALLINPQALAFDRSAGHWIDALELERQLAGLKDVVLSSASLQPADASRLRAAIDLYRGDFLEGYTLREGRGFMEWAALTRERLQRLVSEALERYVEHCLESGDYSTGGEYARRWLTADPYNEEALRQLMWLQARGCQRNAALVSYEQFCRRLADDLNVEPSAATQSVYRRLRRLTVPPPVVLPPDPTPFIGRVDEIITLHHLLSTPTTRLVTVFGPGGIGKTRLALAAARSLAASRPGQFLDGVYFVSLSEADSLSLALALLAEALGLSFESGRLTQDQLIQSLRPKELLLVLDNFERLLSAPTNQDEPPAAASPAPGVSFLVELLAQAPGLRLLVTSRARLNLYEETVFPLEGLELPDLSNPPSLVGLPMPGTPSSLPGALALFLQSARRLDPSFAPGGEQWQAALQLCRTLAGVPLAIELAAGWARQYPCTEIAARVQTSLDFLASTLHNLPERQRSLRAAFNYSWNLLQPAERQALRLLTVLRGDFNVAAAEAVLMDGEPAQSIDQAEIRLQVLVDRALLQPAQGRYAFHPLVRQYAAERAAEGLPAIREEQAAAQQRHAAHFLGWVAGLESGESPPGRAALRKELPNVLAAWEWASVEQRLDLIQGALSTLGNFFNAQSWFQEGIETCQVVISTLPTGAPYTPAQASLLCDLLGRKARMHIMIGQLPAARRDLERALALLEALESPQRRSTVLGHSAITAYYAGDYVQATGLIQESLRISETLGDLEGQAFGHNFSGSCCKARGLYAEARQHFEQAIALHRQLDDELGVAMALNNLGNLAQATGDYTAAQDYYQQSSGLFAAHDHTHGAATMLANAGRLALRQGDLPAARRMFTESLSLKERINDQRGIATALVGLGEVDAAAGDLASAQAQLGRAVQLAHTAGDFKLALEGLAPLAGIWGQAGRPAHATRLVAFILDQEAASQELRQQLVELLTRWGVDPAKAAFQAQGSLLDWEQIFTDLAA
jgi:predicted ATPase/DNA-binding SARP family transcriptional activator